jgi:pimeloyl-ACP methyl ester carboxylesterase
MLNEKIDLVFQGADQRHSKYDVIYPEKVGKLPLLIFCHGFKGFKDWGHFHLICRKLAKAGICVVKFNFSHNGISTNSKYDFDDLEAFAENNYLKELKDINLLLTHLQSEETYQQLIDFDNVSILGHSRGGSMAILAGLEDVRIQRIISWAAVADLEERLPAEAELAEWEAEGVRHILNGRTGQYMPMNYQFVKALQADREALSLKTQLKQSNKPLLIIHGEDDQSVPLEHAYALQIWQPNAELETIPGSGHTFGGTHPFEEDQLPKHSQIAVQATLDFLKRHSGLGSSS